MGVTTGNGVIEVGGKKYPFVPLDSLGVREGFEEFMKSQAYAELKSVKKYMTDEEYAEERAGLRRDITAKLYSWGTEQWSQMYKTLAGQQKLMHLMFSLADPAYDRGVVDDIYRSPKVEEHANHLFTWGMDPNSLTMAGKKDESLSSSDPKM